MRIRQDLQKDPATTVGKRVICPESVPNQAREQPMEEVAVEGGTVMKDQRGLTPGMKEMTGKVEVGRTTENKARLKIMNLSGAQAMTTSSRHQSLQQL